MERKFEADGKKVMAHGTVCRIKRSKRAAKKTARHLNELHRAKMRGWWEPPAYSYS